MKMRELRPGDLILHPMNQSSFQHTAIFVGTGYAVHADADSNFVIREPIEDTERYCPRILDHFEYRFRAHVYRCKKEMLAQKAALYAQRFARTNANDAGATKLGLNRARGVTQELHYLKSEADKRKERYAESMSKGWLPTEMDNLQNDDTPFQFDAIYRALKWAIGGGKANDEFSRNHGTTCAAFVIACYQAAAVNLIASGNEEQIRVAFEILKGWRVDKAATKAARWKPSPKGSSGKMLPDAYKRKFSNVGVQPNVFTPGLSAGELAEAAWDTVCELIGDSEKIFEPEHYMTVPMKVDAKFCFTQTLKERLFKDPNWFNEILEF